jgi:hypothetical protein
VACAEILSQDSKFHQSPEWLRDQMGRREAAREASFAKRYVTCNGVWRKRNKWVGIFAISGLFLERTLV